MLDRAERSSSRMARTEGGHRRMAKNTKTLHCRRCNCLAECVVVKGRPDVVRCPRCGVAGDFNEVQRLAAQHESKDIIKGLQDRIRGQIGKGSKNTVYRPGKIPRRPPPYFIFK